MPQKNHPAFGSDPEWTDEITFYSVYAHLKSLGKGRTAQGVAQTTPLAVNDMLYRKDEPSTHVGATSTETLQTQFSVPNNTFINLIL